MSLAYDFTGQVALVTGASSGIGFATAKAFLKAGAAVVLSDLAGSALDTVAASLEGAGRKLLPVACDVTDEDQELPCSKSRRTRWRRS